MRTKIGAILAALVLAAPGAAGLTACGENDVEREAEQTGEDAQKAGDKAEKEAEKAKEDVEDAVDGN